MNYEMNFKNVLKWLIASLDKETRYFVALELRTKTRISSSPEAVVGIFNDQKKQIDKYKSELDNLKASESRLRKQVKDKTDRVLQLEFENSSKNEKISKLQQLALEMLNVTDGE